MRRSRFGLSTVFLLGAALLVLLGLWLRWTAPRPDAVESAGPRPLVVETLRVAPEATPPEVRRAGVLRPRRDVELFSETSGGVLEIGAAELERVEAGQVLVRVDPRLAEVALERAKASVARAESELDLARLNLKRRQSLTKNSVGSESDLDVAENAERIAAAELREAVAQRDEANDNLSKKTIRAPFDGFLRSFPIEAGEYLREGEQIAELLDLSTIRITVGLTDREVVVIRPGAPAPVEVEAYPGKSFRGEILRVGLAADDATKKFPVEIEVDNSHALLRPGMVARVVLEFVEDEPLLLIPREATIDEFGRRYVYVVAADGTDGKLRAKRRGIKVRNVPFRPESFDVLEGLDAGEEIATAGLRRLSDGAPVERDSTSAP